MNRAHPARRLLRLLQPMAPVMAASAVSRILNQGLGVAIPAVAAAGVVSFATAGPVAGFAVGLVVMALAKGIFRYVEQFTGHAVAFRLLSRLRVDTYRRLVPLAPAGLEDESSGDLVARVIGDIDRVEPFYAHTIAPLASGIAVPIVSAIGVALWVDPVVAVSFLPFPLLMVGFVPWVRGRRSAAVAAGARDQAGEVAAVFTDSIQGSREISVFRADEAVKARVDALGAASGALRAEVARASSARAGFTDLLAGLAVVVVAVVAFARFDSGLIDLAGVAAALAVAWVGTVPARAVEDIVPDVDQAVAAASRLFELSDRQPPVAEPEGDPPGPTSGSITFRGVSVSFPRTGVSALQGVDVTVPDGSLLGVVGPTGSGKSTLIELLLRFRDPDRGVVELGGIDLRRMSSEALRSQVAFVPQRPDLFFGTIADNLRLARTDAGEERLWEALERAALGEWVRSLPLGLDSHIGELGETMSGGQRQRLAIARAFLRDSRVLVLDEATSELDRPSEAAVLAAIGRERGRRTLIVVAHRIDTVVDADEILVLDGGSLVERGDHAGLLEMGGVYAGLWRRHLDALAEPTVR